MQALLDFVIRNLMALWPIARVYEWQRGMMVRCGKIHRELAPGLHWRWWFVDECRTYPATEIVLDLATGAVTTEDGVAVVLSANIGYRMVSMCENWRAVWHLDRSLGALAIGRFASEVAAHTWADLQGTQRRAFERALLASLSSDVQDWGIRITRVHLTDCVQARQHRLFMDPKASAL